MIEAPKDVPKSPLPAVSFLHLDAHGAASLHGSKCASCAAITPGTLDVCPCCGARGQMESIRLGEQGKLYTYSIVHRSYPGTKTPFIAAVVDLDGGGTLKGTLLEVDPSPAAIAFDMPVKIVYRDCGQQDKEGRPFISYYFVPTPGVAP